MNTRKNFLLMMAMILILALALPAMANDGRMPKVLAPVEQALGIICDVGGGAFVRGAMEVNRETTDWYNSLCHESQERFLADLTKANHSFKLYMISRVNWLRAKTPAEKKRRDTLAAIGMRCYLLQVAAAMKDANTLPSFRYNTVINKLAMFWGGVKNIVNLDWQAVERAATGVADFATAGITDGGSLRA